MKRSQVEQILEQQTLPEEDGPYELVETHISLLILGKRYVYKCKKPVSFNFLDFSTLEKRKFYCWEELRLNRRLAPDMYLDVLPISEEEGTLQIACTTGKVIDYCVLMKRMPSNRQMDIMLEKGLVSSFHIEQTAREIAQFHQTAEVVEGVVDDRTLWEDYSDIESVFNWVEKYIGKQEKNFLADSLNRVDQFLGDHAGGIAEREDSHFVSDVHGDLHAKNIFLLKKPVIFDCIEFSAKFRQIDVLNDIAFLLLDLLYFDRKKLADRFLDYYLSFHSVLRNITDYRLLLFYCLYRANVKIKVYALKAAQEEDPAKWAESIEKYLWFYKYFQQGLENALKMQEIPSSKLPDINQGPV